MRGFSREKEEELKATIKSSVLCCLASTEAGQGASRIGVEDAAGNFTGDTVEEILAELSSAGTKFLEIDANSGSIDVQSTSIGNSSYSTVVPACMNGMNLVNVVVSVAAKGITGTTDVQVRRKRDGSDVDMLSTLVTLGDEWVVEDGVIDATNDDVQTGDRIYADVDAVHTGTAPKGIKIVAEFRKP